MKSGSFEFEKKAWGSALNLVGGTDEVGRGSFAGPVVAGCVVFNKDIVNKVGPRIDDSKKLTAKNRKIADEWIRANALGVGIGCVSVSLINKLGIKKAAEKAFRMAILSCGLKIEYLLIDAFYIPMVKGLGKDKQKPIIHGDSLSFSIAAGSIVAKVFRDNLMINLSKKKGNAVYGWDENKGYGTERHRNAIRTHGPSIHHRTKFIESTLSRI